MFDPQYAGQVLMINNSRDAIGAALLSLGYSLNTTDESQLEEAFSLIKQAKDNGVYQAFVMDEVFGKMEGGNAAIAMYYAGDYLTMLENNEDLAFVIPEEGSNWFVDAMCVLKSSQHQDEAYEWINFIASTDSNLANMDYIWYASPTPRRWRSIPRTTRRRMVSRWTRSCTTSWPSPMRCGRGARSTSICRRRR